MSRICIGFLLLVLLSLAGCGGGGDNKSVAGADSTKVRLENLNRLISKDASNPDLYNNRARFYLGDHQVDLALKDINKAITLDPKNPVFYITLSDIYLLMGQPVNCKENLTKAISLDSGNDEAKLKMAKLLLIMKDYPGCYEQVRQLLLLDKSNSQAYYTRAIALLEQGDTNRAIGDLMQAVNLNQDYYDAYVQLGELYALHKDPKAAGYLKNALNVRPQSKEALYMLGMFYQETEQFKSALDVYENLARVDTTIRSAPYNMGYIYLVYLKDFPKAVTLFTEALKRDPGYFEAYFNRGYAYELSGDYGKAYDDYQHSLKIKVNYEKAITGLNRLDKLRR
jgi:tetratricopeptide (TPR) repeat protein